MNCIKYEVDQCKLNNENGIAYKAYSWLRTWLENIKKRINKFDSGCQINSLHLNHINIHKNLPYNFQDKNTTYFYKNLFRSKNLYNDLFLNKIHSLYWDKSANLTYLKQFYWYLIHFSCNLCLKSKNLLCCQKSHIHSHNILQYLE